jgi:UDP-N-acetyl-D-glucosamine dehydrogenase
VAWDVAVIGAGYVGLPLAVRFAETGTRVVCVDPDASKVAQLGEGSSYIGDVTSEELAPLVRDGLLGASTDYDVVRDVGAIIICVPTPLTQNREPDTSFIRGAAASIAERLKPGQVVVLESTTYPGTTTGLLRPILETSGLVAGTDFHLAMSPERIDPGRTDFTVRNTPKVVGGITPACTEAAMDVYRACCEELVPVSSPDAAELSKLLENIFRSVNIAFINEMAIMCDRMGLDVWEVVAAASTKPFGFMRFQPGPGLGGHCLPLDPFYLAWRAREFDYYTEFIELAGKVNENMPYFCASKIARALNGVQRSVRGSRVLVLGLAYKADIDDVRESPAEKIIALLEADGALVSYHDPHVVEHGGMRSVPLDDDTLRSCDCAVIVTAHKAVDYDRVVELAPLVVDLRNATGERGGAAAHVHKL